MGRQQQPAEDVGVVDLGPGDNIDEIRFGWNARILLQKHGKTIFYPIFFVFALDYYPIFFDISY